MQEIDRSRIQWDTAPQTPVAQPAQQQPTAIGGRRVIGGTPPAERRAQEDQALERQRFELQQQNQAITQGIQAENLRLRQESEARAAEKQARETERGEKGFDATEGERKAAAFLLRALGANSSYEGTGVGPRSYIGQAARDYAPDLVNYVTSEERQVAESAQDEFIAASLRQDSGAAIPQEELERQRRIYFPMPGDGPDAIEQKRQARLRAIAGLEQSSGRLLESTQAKWQEMHIPETAGGIAKGSRTQLEIDRMLSGYSYENFLLEQGVEPNQASQVDAFFAQNKGNPNVTAQDVVDFYKSIGLRPPSGDSAEKGAEGLRKGVRFNPFLQSEYAKKKKAIEERINQEVSRRNQQQGEAGYADISAVSPLLDEVSGLVQGTKDVLTGQGSFREGYLVGSSTENVRKEQARANTGALGTAYELLGSAGGIRGVGGVMGGLRAARGVQAAGLPVTRGNIQNALTRRSTIEGAALGAGYGAAEGDTMKERGFNALAGGVAGGVLGNLGQRAANRSGPNTPAPLSTGAQTQMAAQDLGIDVIPAVTGGVATQKLTSAAQQGFISARPIDKAIERMESQGLAAREAIAGRVGQVMDAEDAGNVVRRAGDVFSERTGRIGRNLYDRVEKFGGGQKFPLTEGVKKADEWLADIGRSVQGKEGTIYKQIESLRNKMASGQFEVMSIPRTRDEFRAVLQESGLRGTTLDTAVKQILREAEQDILNGLVKSGNERAVRAFRTATDFWQKRVSAIDEFFEPVLGKNAPKSGEQVISGLERLANPKTGNASQLVGIMKAMPPREANSVRATLINRMGRDTAGAASNADEATFNFSTFMTNWNNMSPRAKAAIFPKEERQALDNLMKVSQAVKQAGSSANRSNTAGALTAQAVISTPQVWFFEPITVAGLTGGQYAVGRLLASPKFAKILAGAPRTDSPQARSALDARLGNLAAAEPELAREIGLYREALAGGQVTDENNPSPPMIGQ